MSLYKTNAYTRALDLDSIFVYSFFMLLNSFDRLNLLIIVVASVTGGLSHEISQGVFKLVWTLTEIGKKKNTIVVVQEQFCD